MPKAMCSLNHYQGLSYTPIFKSLSVFSLNAIFFRIYQCFHLTPINTNILVVQ
jgi:hypothetical protein